MQELFQKDAVANFVRVCKLIGVDGSCTEPPAVTLRDFVLVGPANRPTHGHSGGFEGDLQVVSPCGHDAIAGHTEELDHCEFHGKKLCRVNRA